jgi:hypothetical protein
MRAAGGGLKKMAQSKCKKRGGKCGEQGHLMRTCAQMKVVSVARLKDVSTYGKAQNGNT